MVSTCFYFQVHQPYRLRPYSFFDVGHRTDYFDVDKNHHIIRKVAEKCYLPMNQLLIELIQRHAGRFKVAFSISGTALDQFEEGAPDVIQSFRQLVDTGCVELLAETYYHSLSLVLDPNEFDRQVDLHLDRMREVFDHEPQVFRNTELIFSNTLAQRLASRSFTAILAEGADHVLGWRSPNFVYRSSTATNLKLLLKNYRLSDDIAFRFGNQAWAEHPLTVDKFVRWLARTHGNGQVVNLFMDYETFGEHQWADTGIFEFMRELPGAILDHPGNNFKTPSEIAAAYESVGELDIPDFVSWADAERDLSAWLGNALQESASEILYSTLQLARRLGDTTAERVLQRLTTSDHVYYMCTKWFEDGDVHKYFNPFDSPYEAYIAFMNVLNDIERRLKTGITPEAAVHDCYSLTQDRDVGNLDRQ